MLEVGPTQTLDRRASSNSITVKSSKGVGLHCSESHVSPTNGSPSLKKRSALLKGLKRLGTLFSVNPSASAGSAEVRPDCDPSQRNGFAHATSTPDFPYTCPMSISASPSPSYMDMGKSHRLSSVVRFGSSWSPLLQPHSPSSPFPVAGREIFSDSSRNFAQLSSCDVPALRFNVLNSGAPVLATSPPSARDLTKHQQLPKSSPVTIINFCNSVSSCSSKLDKAPDAASPSTEVAAQAASLASCNVPESGATPPVQPLQPHPQPTCPPDTTLLAVSPAVPSPMRRRVWCLEDYQVLKRLYKGSSASVYKATCLRSGTTVALKVYFLTRVPRNVLHMVKREMELHHQLVHPNIIQLYAAFLESDRIVLVQEYAARGDLFHLLRQMGGRMTEKQVSGIVMRPFLDALAYLHSQGICHRDIKPENILYNDQWVLKIADFGVSINLNDERAVTRAGTVDYMAPEVSRCPLKAEPEDNKDIASLAYTSAVDVWAAGVLSYELLVGFTPMVGPPAATAAAAARLAQQPDCPVSQFVTTSLTPRSLHFPASLSQASRDFVLAALAENPGDRPTARELQRYDWLCG